MPAAEVSIRQPRPEELQLVRDLRYEVLDQDKGLPRKTSSKTDDEATSIHVAAFVDGEVVCTVRLNPLPTDPTTYLIRRMATKLAYRDRGIGASILKAAEAAAIRRGARAFILDARERAVSFYERAGYQDTGDRVTHDGDVNITMIKKVKTGTA